MVRSLTLQDMTTETVVNALVKRWIAVYGVPERIHSDQGTQFKSRLFLEPLRSAPHRKVENNAVLPAELR